MNGKLLTWILFYILNITVFLTFNNFEKYKKKKRNVIENPEYQTYVHINVSPNQLCSNERLFLLVYIFIDIEDFHKRNLIRSTTAKTMENSNNFKTVFVVGKSNKLKINQLVIDENLKFNDIIQGNFIDHLSNSTYKSLCAWKWILNECLNANYFVKLKANSELNVQNLINYLRENNNNFRTLYSDLYPVERENLYLKRKLKAKFHIGETYVMTADLVNGLFHMASWFEFYYLENIYTNILANRIGDVNFINITKIKNIKRDQ